MLYDVNLGTRDYFTYTDAMLNNSLFSNYLKKNGLNVYRRKSDEEFSKDESTRDIVCLDFDFGSRSFDEEFKRLSKLLEGDLSEESKDRIEKAIKRSGCVENHTHFFLNHINYSCSFKAAKIKPSNSSANS